ncbi:MAG: septum formation protein Maf [Caulobacterales bacterium 68-7]|nr:Maf family protein [Caulobacterales bacterium]OJU13259.1 MAG: septum formation protein Maf [Caulobacterales bacterium 68-7]
MSAPQVTLASASQIRATVLRGAGVEFEVFSPGVDEAAMKAGLLAEGASPRDIADALAELKATRAARSRSGLVIGADQTLDLDGGLYDKVGTLEEADARLRLLRGKVHKLHAAVVVAKDGAPIWREVVTTKLSMRPFTDAFLEGYLAREGEALLSSVGCYRLEGEGLQLFDRIDGDYFAILGLPMIGLLDLLRRHGVLAL